MSISVSSRLGSSVSSSTSSLMSSGIADAWSGVHLNRRPAQPCRRGRQHPCRDQNAEQHAVQALGLLLIVEGLLHFGKAQVRPALRARVRSQVVTLGLLKRLGDRGKQVGATRCSRLERLVTSTGSISRSALACSSGSDPRYSEWSSSVPRALRWSAGTGAGESRRARTRSCA